MRDVRDKVVRNTGTAVGGRDVKRETGGWINPEYRNQSSKEEKENK